MKCLVLTVYKSTHLGISPYMKGYWVTKVILTLATYLHEPLPAEIMAH